MVLSSENIVDFFTSLEYVSHIYSSNQAEIKRLGELKDELDQTHRDLSQAKKDADTEAANAEQALSAAQQARQEASAKRRRKAARQAEEAAKAAEAEAAKAETAKEADKQEQADSASAPAAAGQRADLPRAPWRHPATTASTGQASATCSWRSGPAASTHIWPVRLWQARARCSPRPLGTTAWTRVGRPLSPTPKARRACTAPAAATPGAGAAAAGEAGKRPSATTLPALPAATATPSRWRRPEVLPAELGALVQRNACADEYDLEGNPATSRVSYCMARPAPSCALGFSLLGTGPFGMAHRPAAIEPSSHFVAESARRSPSRAGAFAQQPSSSAAKHQATASRPDHP